jgi:hypothetical protein
MSRPAAPGSLGAAAAADEDGDEDGDEGQADAEVRKTRP